MASNPNLPSHLRRKITLRFWLGRNGISKNRHSENRNCSVFQDHLSACLPTTVW